MTAILAILLVISIIVHYANHKVWEAIVKNPITSLVNLSSHLLHREGKQYLIWDGTVHSDAPPPVRHEIEDSARGMGIILITKQELETMKLEDAIRRSSKSKAKAKRKSSKS